jgi:hypothetical protein
VRDTLDLGTGADDAALEVVTGAPTAGATLDKGGAGSHVFVPQFNAVQAGTLTLFAQAAQPLTFIVTEIARGVGDNT